MSKDVINNGRWTKRSPREAEGELRRISELEDSVYIDTRGQKFHPVTITKVDNGFIVVLGCKTFVTNSWQHITGGLKDYWDNPMEAEKKYCGKSK